MDECFGECVWLERFKRCRYHPSFYSQTSLLSYQLEPKETAAMHASIVRNSVRTAALAAKAGTPLVNTLSAFLVALRLFVGWCRCKRSCSFPPLSSSSVSRLSLLLLRSYESTLLPSQVRRPDSFFAPATLRTDFPRHPAASEVSSILESRIAGSSLGADVQETGRVLSTFFPPVLIGSQHQLMHV